MALVPLYLDPTTARLGLDLAAGAPLSREALDSALVPVVARQALLEQTYLTDQAKTAAATPWGIADTFTDVVTIDEVLSEGYEVAEGVIGRPGIGYLETPTVSTLAFGNNVIALNPLIQLPNNETIVKIGVDVRTGGSLNMTIFRDNGGSSYTQMIGSVPFTCAGLASIEYVDLPEPFVVPETGDYYIGVSIGSGRTFGVPDGTGFNKGPASFPGVGNAITLNPGQTPAMGYYSIGDSSMPLSLVSTPGDAVIEPSRALILLTAEQTGNPVLNTDVVASVGQSATEGGAVTWTPVTLALAGTLAGGTEVWTGAVDLTPGQGTWMRYRIQTLNSADVSLHAASLYWS